MLESRITSPILSNQRSYTDQRNRRPSNHPSTLEYIFKRNPLLPPPKKYSYPHTHTHTRWPCRPSAGVPPFRIPRNFRGRGDWRWRPRALRDKLLHPSAPPTLQARILPSVILAGGGGKFRGGGGVRSISAHRGFVIFIRGYRDIYIYI